MIAIGLMILSFFRFLGRDSTRPAEVEGLERLESSKFSLEETILISVHFGGFTRLYAVRLQFWLKCLKKNPDFWGFNKRSFFLSCFFLPPIFGLKPFIKKHTFLGLL